MNDGTDGIKSRLLECFARGVDAPMSDGEFNDLARAVFRYQCEGNEVYASYCRGRGASPETIERWDQIPAVPTRAFKSIDFNAHPTQRVDTEFRTSGTTMGSDKRGAHIVADLDLYRASLLPNFQANLLPEWESGAQERLPMASLALSADALPGSSLSFMLGVVAEELTTLDGYFVTVDGGIDLPGLEGALKARAAAREPLLLVGTAFTFVHWLDSMIARAVRLPLPEGSRIMETGGFKGRSREVARPELYGALTDRLGVPDNHIVNEYGMTELLSQYYEPVLRGRPRRHVSPPWLRTRVLDPATLAPQPDGKPGLIQHVDLANLNSVSAVLTEDLGVLTDDGLELLGRAGAAEPRGCSIAMDELLSVQS